jgi:hypothetical protein
MLVHTLVLERSRRYDGVGGGGALPLEPKKLFSCLFMCTADWEWDKTQPQPFSSPPVPSRAQQFSYTPHRCDLHYAALWRFELPSEKNILGEHKHSCVQNLSLLPLNFTLHSRMLLILAASVAMHKSDEKTPEPAFSSILQFTLWRK